MRRSAVAVLAVAALVGCTEAPSHKWEVLGSFTGYADATTGELVFSPITLNPASEYATKKLAHWNTAPALGNDGAQDNDAIELWTMWTDTLAGVCNPVLGPCPAPEPDCPDAAASGTQYCGGVQVANNFGPPLYDVAIRFNVTTGPVPVGGIPPGFFAENVPPPSPYPLFWYGDVPTGVQSQTRWITFDNASGANFQFAGDLIHIAKETGLENCPVVGSDDDSDGSLPAQDPDCIGWPTFLVPGMLQELCGNGIDDFSFAPDGADCADPTCAGNPACD